MAMSVSQLPIVLVDEAAERILDRLQHVIDVKRCTVMIVRDVNLHFVIKWRIGD